MDKVKLGKDVFSVVTLAKANITRGRLRSFLLATTIALSTMLFLSAVGGLLGLQQPIKNMFSELDASHSIIQFDTQIYAHSQLTSWWKNQPEVAGVTPMIPYVLTTGRPIHKGQEVSNYLMLAERPKTLNFQDKLKFLAGEKKSAPGVGEIWLPSSIAFSSNIAVNDVIEIPTDQGLKSLKVSAIVVDPQYSSGFVSPTRAWVAPGSLIRTFAVSNINKLMFGVRFKNATQASDVWTRFNHSLEGSFNGEYLSYEKIFNSYTQTIQLMGAIVLAFAVISLVVAVFIITTTISGEIMSNYRTFGILKSLGMTPRNIINVFGMQFLLISAIAIPLGVIGAKLLISIMLDLMLETIGSSSGGVEFVLPALLTSLLVVAVIVLAAGYAGSSAGKVPAASAIRFGAPEITPTGGVRFHLRQAHKISLPLALAIRNLLTGKRREMFDFIALSITAFVLFFSVNIYNSMTEMDENLPFWGLDGSDVRISIGTSNVFGMSYQTLKSSLVDDDRIDVVAGQLTLEARVPETSLNSALELDGYIVDGNFDDIGYINLSGRNPVRGNEISIGIAVAQKLSLKLNDELTVNVRGQLRAFTIVGIFQATSNGGFFYRLPFEALANIDPNLKPTSLLVKLHPSVNSDTYIAELQASLGQAIQAEPAEKIVQSQLEQVVRIIGLVLSFISSILVMVAIVSIYNSTAMSIHESKRHVGTFIAIGFTKNQVRLMTLVKLIFLGCCALVAGFLGYCIATVPIMNLLMSDMGMANFPIVFDYVKSLLVIPGILIVCFVSGWFPLQQLAKIQPRSLILE